MTLKRIRRVMLVVALSAASLAWCEEEKWTPPLLMQQRFDLKRRIESATGLINNDRTIGQAEETLGSLAKECDRTLGPDDPVTWMCRNALARTFRSQLGKGSGSEAEEQHRIILRVQENVLGPNHSETLDTREEIGEDLLAQEKYAEAAAEFGEVLKGRQETLLSAKLRVWNSRQALGHALFRQGKFKESETEFRAAFLQAQQEMELRLPNPLYGFYRSHVMDSELGIAKCLRAERKFKEAEAVLRVLLKERENEKENENGNDTLYLSTAETIYELIECLKAQGRRKEVLNLAQHAYEVVKKNEKGDDFFTQYYKKLWDDLKSLRSDEQNKPCGN